MRVLPRIVAALTIQCLVRGHVHRVWAGRIRARKLGAAATLKGVCRRAHMAICIPVCAAALY